jgi:hypothetical protein
MTLETITLLVADLIKKHEDVTNPEMLHLKTFFFEEHGGYCRYEIRRPGNIPVAAALEFYMASNVPKPIWLRIQF